MDENSIFNKIHYYIFCLIAFMIVILSVISYNIYLIAISSLVLLMGGIFLHSGHLLNNMLIKKSKVIEIKNGYKLNSNLISLSKRTGKSYISIAIAKLRPRNGFSYRNEAMKELLESSKEPFELSISLSEVDKKKIVESLETKRRLKEITLSRMKSTSYDKINNLRRQIEIIDAELANIGGGGKSFDVSIILKTQCRSESEYESQINVVKNIEILSNKFSASMGLDYEMVKGEELLNFV